MGAGEQSSTFGTKLILMFYLMISACSFVGSNLFVPVIVTEILGHMHPGWDKDQVVAKSSTMKSFMDGLIAAIGFIALPTLGSLSDSFGRKKIVIVCAFGQIMYMCTIFASYHFKLLWVLYASSIFSFQSGSQMAIIAYMSDISVDDKEKSRNFGLVLASFMLGSVSGSLVLGYLGKYGITFICFLLVGMSTANFLYISIVFREKSDMHATRHERKYNPAKGNPVHSLRMLFTVSSYVTCMVVVYMLVFVAISDALVTGVLYTLQRYDWKSLQQGISGAAASTAGIFWQGIGVGLLQKCFSEETILTSTFFLAITTHFVQGYATQGWMYMGAAVIGGYGSIGFPIMQALISRRIPKEKQGIAFGGLSSLGSIATFIGALIDENVFALCLDHNFFSCPGTPFFIGSSLYLVNGIICIGLFAKYPPVKQIPEPKVIQYHEEKHPLLSINSE